GAGGPGEVPVSDREGRVLAHLADRGHRPVDDEYALASRGRDEALATGQVPERARLGQLPGIGDGRSAGEVEAKVGAIWARDAGLGRRVKGICHGRTAAA